VVFGLGNARLAGAVRLNWEPVESLRAALQRELSLGDRTKPSVDLSAFFADAIAGTLRKEFLVALETPSIGDVRWFQWFVHGCGLNSKGTMRATVLESC
jgi:hypothetical protein